MIDEEQAGQRDLAGWSARAAEVDQRRMDKELIRETASLNCMEKKWTTLHASCIHHCCCIKDDDHLSATLGLSKRPGTTA